MTTVRERYRAEPMGVNATLNFPPNNQIAGFIAKTSGTITVTDAAGRVLVDAIPVTAGVYLPLPLIIADKIASAATGAHQAVITLAGGASGTLLV